VGGKKQRRHYKVETFREELREAINRALVSGNTYQEIADWLAKQGHQIGKSSLQRYGNRFLQKLERVRLVAEQAAAIVSEAGPENLNMQDAASKLATHQITEALLEMGIVKGEELHKLVNALANLHRSDVMRERYRISLTQKAEKAVEAIERKAKSLDPETMRIIREEIYGIA
jgi:Fe2+ transport system protein FeoA